MKKKLESKLVLKKETIEQLDNAQMAKIQGGRRFTAFLSIGRRCYSENHPTKCKCVPC